MRSTYIGFGVFLLVVGAILNWAVADRVPGVDLQMVGLIAMAGGVLAIVLSFLAGNGGYRATRSTTVDPAGTHVEQLDVKNG